MNLPEFSIKQKVLINLITIIIIIVGAVSVMQMQREDFPDVQIDYVFVLTPYPGASPQEVEQLVTIPVEDAIKGLDGIETFSSSSSENSSFVFIELEPNLTNRDRVINEIGREVDKVDLPDDVEDSIVREASMDNPLIEISFTGKDVSEDELRSYVRNLEEEIKDIKDIGAINRVGWRDKEIWVEVDPDDLEAYHVSLARIIQVIRSQNINLPGGKLKSGSKEIIIRTLGELKTAEEFKDVIIRANSDGKFLRVGDIAKVSESFEELNIINKTNGKISINIIPKRKKSGDAISLVDSIKKKVKDFRKTLPPNVSIDYTNDFSENIKRRLNVLISNGKMGFILLFISLLFFLNIRIALITAIGIPFSFLAALLMMALFGYTLNMISMFALILVLGMIVDDAIVVAENTFRYLEKGMSPKEAAIKGCSEVMAPVTATVLTTIAAFLPLMFIAGIMGKVLKIFPLGVIFCLSASLFEALVILPSHLAEWVKPLKSKKETNGIQDGEKTNWKKPSLLSRALRYFTAHDRKGNEARWYQWLLERYTRILKFALDKRFLVGLVCFLILGGTIIFTKYLMPVKMFPIIADIIYVRIELPDGASLEESNEAITKIEEVIMEMPEAELKNVTTTVGFSGEINQGPFDKYGSKYAQCNVYLTPETGRKRKADAIISELREKTEKLNIKDLKNLQFEKMQHGPPVGKPVAVSIKGDDFNVLTKIVREIEAYMVTIEGVEDIKNDYEQGKEEVQVHIDKKEAARLGLNVSLIASTIRFAFEGGVATSIRRGEEKIDVIVKLSEEYKDSIKTLENLTIPNQMNRLVKVSSFAHFIRERGMNRIERVEGKRTITITASVNEDKITPIKANRQIIKEFKGLSARYPGYILHAGGEWEDTTASMKSMLKAFGIAVLLIYLILATQFKSFIQPAIILLTVPFGFVGVIAALYLHGHPLSLMAMFGMVGLTGVVVNDSLILVDFINRRRADGVEIIEAVIDAGRTRLRPIMITSITTIVALLPVVYGIGGIEPFVVPAALAMSYGLLVATFLTLVLVPCVYVIIENIKSRLFYNKKQTP